MESFTESSVFFEKADNTLQDISQKVCHDSDVKPRQYITVLKDCLCSIKELKEKALLAVRSFDDDRGLNSIVSSCSDMMQLSNQLVAKTEQYLGLKHSSVTETSDTEMLKSCSAPVNGDSDRSGDADVCRDSESEDESSEDTAADSSSVARAESTVDNCNVLDRCDPTSTAVITSPQMPTLTDYGITNETLERFALLNVKLEPQSSHDSASQRHPETATSSFNTFSVHQKRIKTEMTGVVSVDEGIATGGRVPLQPCANTRYDVGLFSSSPEAPVLSSLAQKCLRSGSKPPI